MHLKGNARRGAAALLLAPMLLAGCKGTVDGRETVELAAGYMNDGAYAAPYPGMRTETQVQGYCEQFLKKVWAGDYESAMSMLTLTDLTFVDISTLKQYVEDYGLVEGADITYTEYIRDGIVYVDCKAGENPAMTLKVDATQDEETKNYSFALTLPNFVATDYGITVPQGTKVTLDGKDISGYSEDGAKFVIPFISKGEHTVAMSNIFVEGIEAKVDVQNGGTDLSSYMYVTGDLRTQLINISAQTLQALNKTILTDDWDTFRTYFVPDMNMSDFSVPFHTAYNMKSIVYGLEMTKIKDLEQVDHLDVRYTGYDTVEVKLGTSWKWAAKGGYTYNEKKNEYKVTKWSDMNIVNTLELYYDGKTLYVKDIDDASLTRLTDGLEEWR